MALTDNLVAKYVFDFDGSDSVGSNDGTNANVTFADGAAQFNGSNARFTLASEPFTASDADYTISVWAMHNNLSGNQRLLGWGDLNGRYFVGYHTGLDQIYIGMGDIDINPTVAYKPVAGQVEHWVFSNSGNTTKFYKDGVLVDTVVHGTTGAISAGAGMRIGSVYAEYGEYLNGSMDDLRIWDRQLSDAEVADLYSAGAEPYVAPTLSDLLVLRHHAEDTSADVGDAAVTLVNVASEEVDGKSVWSFSGQDSIVRLDDVSDQPDLTGDFSISMWFKGLLSTGTWRTAARCYTADHPILVSFDTDLLGVYDNDTNAFVSSGYTMDAANFTDWNHITAVGSGNSTKFYINGSLVGEAAAKASGALYAIGNHAWSGDPTAGTQKFADYIDDVCVFSGALTDAQVLEHYNAGADTEAIPETVSLTFLMQDSYGDGWNGSTFQIYDGDSNIVQSHTLAGGYTQTVQFDIVPASYTWAFVNQNWMSEITATLTRDDTSEQLLFSSAGSVLSGAFDLSPATADISPTLAASNGEITISATLNAEATAAGATGWAYALTDIFVEGQAHGGTAMAIGVDATESPTPHGVHTIYVAAIDAAGLVIVANSASIDNTPSVSITIVKSDSYNDSWDGSNLVITNSSAVEVHNATLASGASPETILLDLPYGTYDWAMVGGSYHNEHTVTITLTSDGSQLAHSAGHSPSSGSFTVGPPAAAISATVSVSGADITVTGVANATAVSEGAALWSASLTEYGEVGAALDGAKMVTALGVDAVVTAPSGGTHTVYVAVVDAGGIILAKSSVSASVFLSKIGVGSQMIVMSYLQHPSLSPQGTHAQLTNDDGDLKWGPFYIGDLAVKTGVNEIDDGSEIGTIVTFDDGSGGTLDLDELVKELIKKYNLNMLWGDNSNDGIFFQAILDGTNGISPSELLGWNAEDTHTIMLEADGGGWYADYDTQLISGYPNAGDLMISEVQPGNGATSGPDGSSFLGIIAPGETAPAQTVGEPAKIQIKFGGAIYTSSVVIKDANGDHFATFGGQPLHEGTNYWHADALAGRAAGKLIHTGDSNAYNTDGNGTPKSPAIGIMTAIDGGGTYDISGYNFQYSMSFPSGDYTVQMYAGYNNAGSNLPTKVYILDANDNLVTQAQSDGSGFDATYYSFTIAGAEAPAGGGGVYDWTHGGNLTNIVKFCRGKSGTGVASYGYAKKEDNDTTTLYFATDMQTWATFGTYDASASGIDGSPVCMEYGSDGKVFVGTDNGKIYEVTLDGDSVPNTFVPLYTMPGGESINTAKYGATSGEWIFEAGGKMYTIPVDGSVATERYTLPAGAKCVDIAEADDGIAMILRKADFSLEPRFALANWTNIVGPAGMSTDMANLSATDLNYSYALDQWVASSADGNVLTTADLITFLSA